MNLEYPFFNDKAENLRTPNNDVQMAMKGAEEDSWMQRNLKRVLCIQKIKSEQIEIRGIKRFTVNEICWKDPEKRRVECKKHSQNIYRWIWQFLKTLFIMTFIPIMPIKKRDSRR